MLDVVFFPGALTVSEEVLPLVYNALESEHSMVSISMQFTSHTHDLVAQVQERALEVVPNLCETIDYAEVSGVLFPRVAVCLDLNTIIVECTHVSVVSVYQDQTALGEGCHIGHLPEYGEDS